MVRNQKSPGGTMSESFNIKPFGLNVIPSTKTREQVGKNMEDAIGTLWSPVLDYLKENEDVFSGDIASEINKINFQTMRLGMVMDENKEIRNLDTKF